QSERKERNLFQGFGEQQADVFGRIGRLLEKSDFNQVLRRHRQRDGVADSLMEAVVGAVAKQKRLLVVSALIEIVAELVVNRGEVFARDVYAHLDAQILDV